MPWYAARLDTAATWPEPRRSMSGSTASMAYITPNRFTSIIRTCSGTFGGSHLVGMPTPAFATSKSTGPRRSVSDPTAASSRSRSATSAVAVSTVPPRARMAAASWSSKSCRRATRPSRQPTRARSSASAQPMPLDAPVTTATLPVQDDISHPLSFPRSAWERGEGVPGARRVPAERVAQPPPATYDATLRSRIRAARNERIPQFFAMTRYLESLGFQRVPGDPNEPADPAAERMTGTLPSKSVRAVFREPHVQAVLLVPSGAALPDDPAARVLVDVTVAALYTTNRQEPFWEQTGERLALLGFVPKVGYDHRGF